jgi:hypothetical protein
MNTKTEIEDYVSGPGWVRDYGLPGIRYVHITEILKLLEELAARNKK